MLDKYIKSLQFPEHAFKCLPSEFFEYPYNEVVVELQQQYARSKTIDVSLVKNPIKEKILQAKVYKTSFNEYETHVRETYARRILKTELADNIEVQNSPSILSLISRKISNILFSEREGIRVMDVLKSTLDGLYNKIQNFRNGRTIVGIHTKIGELTRWIGGWQPFYYVIAARSSQGKTALLCSEIDGCLEQNKKVVVFSVEMTRNRIMDRLLICRTGVDAEKYRNGELNDDEINLIEKAVTFYTDKNLIIDDYPSATAKYISNKTLQYVNDNECDIVFIDYLQIVKSSLKDETAKITEVTNDFKELSKESGVPIIAAAQVLRSSLESTDKRPKLHHLKGGSAIEESADAVFFLHRPWYYGEREYENGDSTWGIMEIIIAKFRDGVAGQDCIIKAHHNKSITNFSGTAFDEEPKPINPAEGFETVIPIDFSASIVPPF